MLNRGGLETKMKKIYTLFFALALTVALPTSATIVLAATDTSTIAEVQAAKLEEVTTDAKFTD
jgi:hypothetical protein